MSKKIMLIAAAVFGFTLSSVAQNNPAPSGAPKKQAATQPAKPKKAKTARNGKFVSKKPPRKAGNAAKTPPATTTPATK